MSPTVSTLRIASRSVAVVSSIGLAMSLLSCSTHDQSAESGPPGFITGEPRISSYDGATDDLLTAGLGVRGLASATKPGFADADKPTAAELRRLAIYSNYRALVDMSTDGGFGRLWGPNIDTFGRDTGADGKIAGTEYTAVSSTHGGSTVLTQIPAGFNRTKPCLVAAPASGSRGVYGAISATGEWGLKHNCAVTYTDKGAGNQFHDQATGIATTAYGEVVDAPDKPSVEVFVEATANDGRPQRIATKHAHSQHNPEQYWGEMTLESIEFAYWAINDHIAKTGGGRTYAVGEITTIAAAVSNGGGAVLAAAELDRRNLIQGVVAGEPQVQLAAAPSTTVLQDGRPVAAAAKPLADYITTANLLQPCAAAAASLATAPQASTAPAAETAAARRDRCAVLAQHGIISGGDLQSQAQSALDALHRAGYLPDSDVLQPAMWDSQTTSSVAVTYLNAYTKSTARQELCGYSFAAGASPRSPLTDLYGAGNGVPPTNGINLAIATPAGPRDHRAVDAEAAFASANCLRSQWEAGNLAAPGGTVAQLQRTGRITSAPTIILHGRSDTLIPVNHTSRPYVAQAAAAGANISYYEIIQGQHFDALLPTFKTTGRLTPMHHYNLQALDAMWQHLTAQKPIPPSQVVRAALPGTPVSAADLPSIATVPAGNAIAISNGRIDIPT